VRRFRWIIVFAVALGVACWFFGLDVLSSIVISLAVGATGATWASFPDRRPAAQWPPGPALSLDGARREAAQLSWSLSARPGMAGDNIVSETVVARIRVIAANRLASRQLDLDDPAHRAAIVQLLGRQAWELVNPGRSRAANLTSVLRSLDVIDSLGPRPQPTRTRSTTSPD
jgi:hypothetical protein